jgi:hypothetical protein
MAEQEAEAGQHVPGAGGHATWNAGQSGDGSAERHGGQG